MNRRYSNLNGMSVGRSGQGMRRLSAIVILLLVMAVVATLIICLPAVNYRRSSRTYMAQQMLHECESATVLVNKLSRTASSNSYGTLAQIRSSVYAMDVLNQAEKSLSGRPLVDEGIFTRLYATLDSYNNKLITGMVTGDLQTELAGELAELHTMVENIE